ncbi:MAG: hypothetical protein FWB95_06305 [Treponema sp.]|nr:hypothetical protein [Treponema sp.]
MIEKTVVLSIKDYNSLSKKLPSDRDIDFNNLRSFRTAKTSNLKTARMRF